MKKAQFHGSIEDRLATAFSVFAMAIGLFAILVVLCHAITRLHRHAPLSPAPSQSIRPTAPTARDVTAGAGELPSASRPHAPGDVFAAGQGVHVSPGLTLLELRHWPEQDDFIVRDDAGTVRVTITKEALRWLHAHGRSIEITSGNAARFARD